MNPKTLSNKAMLRRLGAGNSDSIFEVIVSTCDANGVPNSAPMGIRFLRALGKVDEEGISIKPFKSTNTYRNLSSQREAVINVTSDPVLFYETAFKHSGAQRKLKGSFCAAKTVRPPRVRGCEAYIEVSVRKIIDAGDQEEERSEVLCQVKSVQIRKPEGRLYSRAPYMLIEAIIHATRVGELRSQGLVSEADELMRLIDRYIKLIHRVAPSSKYEDLAVKLATIAGARREGTTSGTEEDEGDA